MTDTKFLILNTELLTQIDGLLQARNASVIAMELRRSCTNPSESDKN